ARPDPRLPTPRTVGEPRRRGLAAAPAPADADARLVETFCEALWLEDGLARNTLAAYQRDLILYAQWLRRESAAARREEPGLQEAALARAGADELQHYIAARHPGSKATSAN